MGIKRTPWEFCDRNVQFFHKLGSQPLYWDSEQIENYDKSITETDTFKNMLEEDNSVCMDKAKDLNIVADLMTTLYHCRTPGRPIDVFNKFMRPIFQIMQNYGRHLKRYYIVFDQDLFMPPEKLEEQKERDKSKDPAYQKRHPDTIHITDEVFYEDNKQVPLSTEKLMGARQLRTLLYDYIRKRTEEEMKELGLNQEIVFYYDSKNGPWFVSAKESIQRKDVIIETGEADITVWRIALMLRNRSAVWVKSDDSDHLALALKHGRRFKHNLFLTGANGRHVNITRCILRIRPKHRDSELEKIFLLLLLNGTDYVKKALEGVQSKMVYDTLDKLNFDKDSPVTSEKNFTNMYKTIAKHKRGKPVPHLLTQSFLKEKFAQVLFNYKYWSELQNWARLSPHFS